MQTSSRWRFFTLICGFFWLVGQLMGLDVMTAWPGAEGLALERALGNDWGGYLPSTLHHLLLPLGAAIDAGTDAIFLFPRLLSTLCLVLTAVITYRWAGRLFGGRVATLGLLCAGGSLFLPFFGRVATADALALLGQAGMYWTALLYAPVGQRRKLFLFGASTLLAAVAAPLSTALLAGGLLVAGLADRKNVRWWSLGGVAVAVAATVWVAQGATGFETYWFYGRGGGVEVGRLLLYTLLGALPAIGWVAGGLRDLVYKVRRGEQFSLLLLGGLLAGLLAESLLFPLLLALLAGKQMQLYFTDARYPWRDFVRAGAVLHLIGAFLAVFLVLAGGGLAFPGAGFRAALGMAAAYWIFSLLGVLGLFGERRDFALGGTLLAGLLATMFFWVQVYPYLEAERSWPRRMVEAAGEPATLRYPDPEAAALNTALPYFRRAGWRIAADGKAELVSAPAGDTTLTARTQVRGRVVLRSQQFGLRR